MKSAWFKESPGTAIPLLLGMFAFFLVVGPNVLNPNNIAWLEHNDPATHYLGWHFFRNSEWSFPLGLSPDYGLEISNAIFFSDSIPLLAFLFKPMSSLLPETFQYFGFWLFACFILQAWFAWKIIGLISDNPLIRLFGAGLFVFAPTMIFLRLPGHHSLLGHFLILAAIYLSLRRVQKKRTFYWATALAVAALVHAYLLAMVAVLWLGDLIQVMTRRDRSPQFAVMELAAIVLLVTFVCWQAGYFTVGSGVASAGFGYYRLDPLNLLNADGWSYVLPNILAAKTVGTYYLGLGVIILALCAFPALLSGRTHLAMAIKKRTMLLFALIGLTAFALSNKIGIGPLEFEFPLPEPLLNAANMFRVSSRMIWPAYYVLILTVIFIIVRGNKTRTASYLLAIALVVQVADTSIAWQVIRKTSMVKPAAAWATPLKNVFWAEAAAKYEKVRWMLPAQQSPQWQVLSAFAGQNSLSTDAALLARVDKNALLNARIKAKESLYTGRYDSDSLYFLDAISLKTAILHLNEDTDVLAQIDGFNVIAPGWKKCRECRQLTHEVQIEDIFPPLKVGERIQFFQARSGVDYLGFGWSQPEKWGTWSDGSVADIILPITAEKPSVVILEANAFLHPELPEQRIEIRMNGVLATRTNLTKILNNRIEAPIPRTALDISEKKGYLHLQLKFPDAVSPKEIGQSIDSRSLALALLALTIK